MAEHMVSSTDEARQALIALVQRVGRGDRSAFKSLYDATSAKLYGIIIRILRDPDLSKDLLQEVYVRIFERASEFNASVASPITWMATIARNRALDDVRRVRPAMVDIGEDFDPPAETGHPLDGRERSEELRRLLDCLSGLDAEKRQMVMLAYYKGATREALAQRFSRPVATVKTVLHRSLAQLRECLQQ
jgi:RNA polymerase sigma-70 factor, ECF subfamily